MYFNKCHKFYCLLLLAILWGCNDIYFTEFPEHEKLLVCNCIFQPDLPWEVELFYTFEFIQSLDINYENNAEVYVVSEENDSIRLYNTRNGVYRSNQYPEIEKNYHIMVTTLTDTIKSTPSKIPAYIPFEIDDVDLDPGNVQYRFYTMNYIYKVDCSIDLPSSEETNVMIRAMQYDSIEGAKQYLINDSVLNVLTEAGVQEDACKYLELYKNDTLQGYAFDYLLMSINEKNSIRFFDDELVKETAFIGSSDIKSKQAFNIMSCYSTYSTFIEFVSESCTLLGEFNEPSSFSILLENYMEGEYWLEYRNLSDELLKQYESHIYQYMGRADYNSIQDPVYSNMSNGVGIFGGMQEEMIHLEELDAKE